MSQITITSDALKELHERRISFPPWEEIWIMGPLSEDWRAPRDLEENWLLGKLYGPAPRWSLQFMSLGTFQEYAVWGEKSQVTVENIDGIRVVLIASQPAPHLSIELTGDAIRVYERNDA